MQKEVKKRSWIELILYVLSFIMSKFKQKQEEQAQQQQIDNQTFANHTQNLQNQYDKIDAATQNNENTINNSGLDDVANHLNNRF